MPQQPTRSARKKTPTKRLTAAKRGYDSDWNKLRKQALERDHYLCQHCLQAGRATTATDVDHKTPFKGIDDPKRLDLTNLQSLCAPCHSRKTAKEDGGLGHSKKSK